MTPLQLLLHVFLNEVHGHMSRSFVHHLHAAFPGPFRQVPLGLQLPELRLIVRIRQGTRTQSVPDREANVIRGHDIANVVPMSPKEVLLVMGQTPLGHDRSSTAHDPGHPLRRQRNKSQQHPGVDGEVIHPLFRLFDQRVPEHLPGQILCLAPHLLESLINRHGADRHR